jgi:3',5'-cyclic AMP phosphodiesterase CpdA
MPDVSLLHIPDLHYVSPKSNYLDDNKAEVPDALRVKIFRNLNAILQFGFAKNPVHAITVGGDITTGGDPRGFDVFESEASKLLHGLVADRRAICITAGNHDVVWNLNPQENDYFDRKFRAYRSLVERLGATSCVIPKGKVPESADGSIEFDCAAAGPLYFDLERRFLILCINSSMRCGEINLKMRDALSSKIRTALKTLAKLTNGTIGKNATRGALTRIQNELIRTQSEVDRRSLFDIPHVTHVQMDYVSGLLMKAKEKTKDWESFLKIALIHHHLVPFDYQMPEYKPFEVMADAASTLEALASFDFHLVLTGHKHQPYIQQVRFGQHELLVVGGMTVGGYPVPGFGQGVRLIRLQRDDDNVHIRVADVPCNRAGNTQALIEGALKEAEKKEPFTLHPTFNQRHLFPAKVEKAVEKQLYGRAFYKTDTKFDVKVTAVEGSLCFDTKFSYTVVNRTSEAREWRVEYKFDRQCGTVEEARVKGKNYDPEQQEFRMGRGLSIPVNLAPEETAEVYLRVKETWPEDGSTLYTSYNPTTDLRVIVRANAPKTSFDFEPLYFLDEWDKLRREENYYEIFFDKGVLPFEGLRLNWKKKEKSNGKQRKT